MVQSIIRTNRSRQTAGALAALCLAGALAVTGCSKPAADVSQGGAQAQAGGPGAGGPPAGGARGNRRLGEVLQSLGLSDDQKDQIRKIMSDARTQAKTETDPDQRRSTLRAAFAKVQDVLTPAQRDAFKAKMQALRNSSAPAGGSASTGAQ